MAWLRRSRKTPQYVLRRAGKNPEPRREIGEKIKLCAVNDVP